MKKRNQKKNSWVVYDKQFKGRCHKCGKIGHKSTDPNFLRTRTKKWSTRLQKWRRKSPKISGKRFNCEKTGHKKDDCPELIGSSYKAKQLLDEKESADLVLCMVSETIWMATKEKKKSVSFLKSFKEQFDILPSICETGMMYTIDGEFFFNFTKSSWISYLATSYHITNNDAGMYDITEIDEPVQGSSSNMKVTKKGKLHLRVNQIDGSEIEHTL